MPYADRRAGIADAFGVGPGVAGLGAMLVAGPYGRPWCGRHSGVAAAGGAPDGG